jgi:hypothetical protein
MFIYHRNVSVLIVLIVAFLSCLETVLILMPLNHRNVSVYIVASVRKPNNDALSHCYAFLRRYEFLCSLCFSPGSE